MQVPKRRRHDSAYGGWVRPSVTANHLRRFVQWTDGETHETRKRDSGVPAPSVKAAHEAEAARRRDRHQQRAYWGELGVQMANAGVTARSDLALPECSTESDDHDLNKQTRRPAPPDAYAPRAAECDSQEPRCCAGSA